MNTKKRIIFTTLLLMFVLLTGIIAGNLRSTLFSPTFVGVVYSPKIIIDAGHEGLINTIKQV